MLDSKKHTVQICGEVYTFVSDETPARIAATVSLVDSLMCEVAADFASAPLKKVAVLTALKVALELTVLKDANQQTQQNLQLLLGQFDNLK